MENFIQGIRNRFKKKPEPFPNVNSRESGGNEESLLFQIGNLERKINTISQNREEYDKIHSVISPIRSCLNSGKPGLRRAENLWNQMPESDKKMIGNSGLTQQQILENNFSLYKWWTNNKIDVTDQKLREMKRELVILKEGYEKEKSSNPYNGQPQNNPSGHSNNNGNPKIQVNKW